jgi:hypothetical protein
MVNVGFPWIAVLILLVQIAFVIWFIDTLTRIKIHLREIRDILRQSNREL